MKRSREELEKDGKLEVNNPPKRQKKESCESFKNFGISEQLLKSLTNIGIVKPSKIQSLSIPLVLLNCDLIAQSKNGTGKTLIFSILSLEKIDFELKKVQSIILVPTREIAIQVHSVITKLSKNFRTPPCCNYFIGGGEEKIDYQFLEKGTQIVVATAGRFLKILSKKKIELSHLKHFILDEADKLFSFQLEKQTKIIIDEVKNQSKNVQILAFSATFSKSIRREIEKIMTNPESISVIEKRDYQIDNVQEFYVSLPLAVKNEIPNPDSNNCEQKPPIIQNYETKKRKLLDLMNRLNPYIHQSIIFSSTTSKCSNISEFLKLNNFKCEHLTSRLSQPERNEVIQKFRNYETRILVTTQVLSRGVDFNRVNVVINFNIPEDSNEYIHQMGRTGRMGRAGLFINFIVSEVEFRKLEYSRRLCSESKPIKNLPKIIHPSLFVPKFEEEKDNVLLDQFLEIRNQKQRDQNNYLEVMNDSNFLLHRGKRNDFSSKFGQKKKKKKKKRRRRTRKRRGKKKKKIEENENENKNENENENENKIEIKEDNKKEEKKKEKKEEDYQRYYEEMKEIEIPSHINISFLPPPQIPQEIAKEEKKENRNNNSKSEILVFFGEENDSIHGGGEKKEEESFEDILNSDFGVFSSFLDNIK